jgi:DNA-binding response OmpR family regulator/REP element-mobilizing transposase RayT
MAVHVLIGTRSPQLGEFIQHALEDAGGYQPVLASDRSDLLARARQTPFELAILDAELEAGGVDLTWKALKEILPQINLLLIKSEDSPLQDQDWEIEPDYQLTQPLKPDWLLRSVRAVLDDELGISKPELPPALDLSKSGGDVIESSETMVSQTPQEDNRNNLPPWLEDVNRAAQHLTRLSLEASAQAALITRRGALWAYAGQLSQPAAQELSNLVDQDWVYSTNHTGSASHNGSDLVRFVRLNTTGGEFMLYATGLGEDMVLALAFDAETPFSRIRAQASHLAKALASPPLPEQPLLDQKLGAAGSAEEAPVEEELPELELPPLFSAESVPPHRPSKQDQAISTPSGEVQPSSMLENGEREIPIPLETGLLEQQPASPHVESAAGAESTQAEPLTGAPEIETLNNIWLPENETADRPDLEPLTSGYYNLTCLCLLIPRIPEHYLVGELSTQLSAWMRQLSVAFGWRLEYLSVRPLYLMWTSSAPPTISPSFLVDRIRRHTSHRIFKEFPQLAYENPSGDFWAPPSLAISTGKSPSPQVLKKFIETARRQQGIENNR